MERDLAASDILNGVNISRDKMDNRNPTKISITITEQQLRNKKLRSRGTRWVPRVVLGLPFPKLTVQAQETNRQQEAGHLTAGDRSVISVPVGVPRLGSYFLGCPVIAGVKH